MRGRGAGGAARRRDAVGVGRWPAGEPARVAADGRGQAAHRHLARRCGQAAPGGLVLPGDPARRPGGPARRGPGRHADLAVPVLSPRAVAVVAGRADAAGGRRPDHGGDRARVRRGRADDGPADQPRQAAGPGSGHTIHDALGVAAPDAARGRPAGALPGFQRGVHGFRRPVTATCGPDGRGDPAGPHAAPAPARRSGNGWPAGADAADRGAAGRADLRRRIARAVAGAGSRPVGRRAHRRGRGTDRVDLAVEPGARPVPAPGGDRRGPRRGALGRGHRLDGSPGLWDLLSDRLAGADDDPGPGRRRRDGARAGGRAVPPSSQWPATWGETTGCTRCAGTCWRWPGMPPRPPDEFRAAARYATNIPERRYLERKAARLSGT